MATRAITPIDVSDLALYTEDRWHEPFAKLRAEMPVSWRPDSPYGGYWSVVTHDLVTEVELHPEIFSSSWIHGNITIADPAPESNLQNFIAQDPPIHTAQRKVIAPAFSPSQLGKLEDQVQARTRALLDTLPIGETFDWVETVSIPLTIGMLCILFDMPWEQRHDIKRWSDWASNIGPETQNEGYRAAFMQQMMEMLQRFDGFMDARRNLPPSDDLLSRMVHSDAMGNMSPIERLSNIALLIVGGNDTTRNSMSALVEAFQKFPGEVDKLRTDPSLAANAAQEIIRWQSPVTHSGARRLRIRTWAGRKLPKAKKS
jgi:cytochrome P450